MNKIFPGYVLSQGIFIEREIALVNVEMSLFSLIFSIRLPLYSLHSHSFSIVICTNTATLSAVGDPHRVLGTVGFEYYSGE